MDIEGLNRTQIVLLTLLISFVTSIATGIVTVTLLDQAPPAVTRTISRVVERTIERVVPDKQNASVITKEVTVIVTEEDLITEAILQNTRSTVRIGQKSGGNTATDDVFISLGIVITENGMIATDRTRVVPGATYAVTGPTGELFDASVVYHTTESPIALLRIVSASPDVTTEENEENISAPITFTAATLRDINTVKLGQTVITLAGITRTLVAIGIVSGFQEEEVTEPEIVEVEEDTGTKKSLGVSGFVSRLVGDVTKKEELKESVPVTLLTFIETTISAADTLPGSPLVDLEGAVIGIKTHTASENKEATYIPVHAILTALSAFTAEDTEKGEDTSESTE